MSCVWARFSTFNRCAELLDFFFVGVTNIYHFDETNDIHYISVCLERIIVFSVCVGELFFVAPGIASMSFLERLKLVFVRTSSRGAFPVTEKDLAKYQKELLEHGVVQENRSQCSSCSSFEDCIVHITLDEVETKVQTSLDIGDLNDSNYAFDMSLFPGKALIEDSEKDAGFMDDAIEFMYDDKNRGEDDVLLLNRTKKPLRVREKVKQAVLQPLRSTWSRAKALGERVQSFRKQTSSLGRKRRSLDETASLDGEKDEDIPEFEKTPSGSDLFFRSSNDDDSATHQ